MADETPKTTPTNTATVRPGSTRAPQGGMASAFAPRKKREKAASEYKKSLKEKQALKKLYGLSEKQLKRYVLETLDKIGKVNNLSDELIRRLEIRLDNVVFRLGFAKTRAQARQLVSHAYFLVNGKAVNIASYQVELEDEIGVKETKKKKLIFANTPETLKKSQGPSWLKLDANTWKAEVTKFPNLSEVNPPVELSLIFEFYSR